MMVVFRVDASTLIGAGHFMRCLTLAEVLRERGVIIQFICREHQGNLISLLQKKAIPVRGLPSPLKKNVIHSEDYAEWLGVEQSVDAMQTIEALNAGKPDWLVVDHYGLDIEWELQLRPHIGKLMVIDDLANRKHDCDVLLDQNYSIEGDQRYKGLVPKECRLLIGSYYALLSPEYFMYRQTLRVRDGQVRRVLVYFGASDSNNMTGLMLKVLSLPEFKHLEVDVVIGVNNPHRVKIEKQAAMRLKTNVYNFLPNLADLMVQTDVAIGAGGSTTWERMCLGLPSLVISIAKNQRSACEALSQAKVIQYVGDFSTVKSESIVKVFREWIKNEEFLLKVSTQNQLLVDGLGALRLTEIICLTPKDALELRLACRNDIIYCFNCANDFKVFLQSTYLKWMLYKKWFVEKLSDSSIYIFILYAGRLPVGQIYFDLKKDEAQTTYFLDTFVRDRDWEARLISMGSALVQKSRPIRSHSEIKSENHYSHSVFIRKCIEHDHQSLYVSEGTYFSIAILSDRNSWINEYIQKLVLEWIKEGHRVLWVHDSQDLSPGDICFYLSCSHIVTTSILSRFLHNLVVHESDLPKGKGWSPLTWQILEGRNRIPITLFEALEKVDSGQIYAQLWLEFKGHELIGELRDMQAQATLSLCKKFINEYPQILKESRRQEGKENYYSRRKPIDSQLNPQRSIESQFNLFRVVDNERYPAFFDLNGQRYLLKIEKTL